MGDVDVVVVVLFACLEVDLTVVMSENDILLICVVNVSGWLGLVV